MNRDDDDLAIAKVWRGVSGKAPDPLLDARILAAARAHQRRRLLVPLAALLAACLVLAFHLTRQPPVPAPESFVLDTTTFGLDVGRQMQGDTEAMRQMLIRQQPGGSVLTDVVQP